MWPELINYGTELREFLLLIKFFIVTKMEILKNMLKRISLIPPWYHKTQNQTLLVQRYQSIVSQHIKQ